MRESADCCDDYGAKQADDNDLQMSAPISAINGMVHWTTPVFYTRHLLFRAGCDQEHTSVDFYKALK
jgi:hypothetical protein